MLRTLFALVAGLFATMIVITGLELVSAKWLFPPPPGLDFRDPDAVNAFVGDLPVQARAWIAGGWLAGAFVGGVVATALTLRHWVLLAILIGGFVAAGTIYNTTIIHHPYWMVALGAVLPIPVALGGGWLLRKVWQARGR